MIKQTLKVAKIKKSFFLAHPMIAKWTKRAAQLTNSAGLYPK
ncbi:hypothetical protein CCP3SC15_1590009 [Gammaproteobacteria bacterium]